MTAGQRWRTVRKGTLRLVARAQCYSLCRWLAGWTTRRRHHRLDPTLQANSVSAGLANLRVWSPRSATNWMSIAFRRRFVRASRQRVCIDAFLDIPCSRCGSLCSCSHKRCSTSMTAGALPDLVAHISNQTVIITCLDAPQMSALQRAVAVNNGKNAHEMCV